MRKLILYFILLWPFVWDNATQAYGNAQLIEVNKAYLQAAEVASLVVFTLYVLVRKMRGGRLCVKVAWFIPAIFIIGIVSGFCSNSLIEPILRVSYLLVRPFLVFFILVNLGFSRSTLRGSILFYFAVAAINGLVNIGQYVMFGIFGDHAAGLMYNSHTLANYLAFLVFYGVSYVLMERRYSPLILTPPFLASIVIASHEKAFVIMFAVLPIIFFLVVRHNIKRLVQLATILLLLLGVGAASVYIFSPRTVELLEVAAENVDELGPVKVYDVLFKVFGRKPETILLGLGPGNYGSVYNTYGSKAADLRRMNYYSEEIYYATVLEEVAGGRRSLWAARTNLYVAVVSEYGVLGMGLFLMALYRLLRMLYKYFQSNMDVEIKWLSLGTLVSMMYTLLLGLTYLLTGYNAQSNIFPLMAIAALIHSTVKEENRDPRLSGVSL